jgi:radical SAM superfamily enzyme YgiQ (UPF0313 family)
VPRTPSRPLQQEDRVGAATCDVLLVYPRFTAASFWNYQETCELIGARYPAAPLGLITVAAMLPKHWRVRLIDRNAEELLPEQLDAADLVLTGGMLPQQADLLDIIDLCRSRGKPVVVGGPDVTSSPHVYQNANFRVLGEAELVMDALIEAWNSGAREGVFEAEKYQADVTSTPTPRFDLLDFGHYLQVGVQFSRGCPFTCEFCDITELYGRVPRTKTTPQVLAELDTLYSLGYRGHVDFVDDNLIGNKKALRLFLPELIRWQRAHGYPFEFSTEASINLADNDELLGMLREANFFTIFVGIESPDPATLNAMHKKQNTRRSLVESVHKIYQAGIFVNAGFILGFDSEKGSIADQMIRFVEETAIPICTVGLLYALPNTQLTRRLTREGRLYAGHEKFGKYQGDQCTSGLNFVTARMRRDILDDYTRVLERIYSPSAYFGRVRRVGRALKRRRFGWHRRHMQSAPQRDALRVPFLNLKRSDLARFAKLMCRIALRQPSVLPHFWRTYYDCARHNPAALRSVVTLMLLYLHLGPFARHVVGQVREQMAMIDRGEWRAPALLPAI